MRPSIVRMWALGAAGLASTLGAIGAITLGAAVVGCGSGSSSRSRAGASTTVGATSSGSTSPLPSASPMPSASPPTVQAVAPTTVWNDQSAVLVVQGSGFFAPTEVRLVDASGVVTLATGVVVRSTTEVEATFAAGMTPAARLVVVATPAGTSAGGPAVTVVGNVDPDVAGGHLVGWRDVQLQGASGDRPEMRIYYPATAAALGAPVDMSRAPYPIVAYGHGFRPPLIHFGIGFRNNAFLAARLASFGYVVACPDLATNNQLFGAGATGQANSGRDADDLVATLDDLTRRGQDPQDALFAAIDGTRAAIGGHSRGGDGAMIAAAREAARSPRRVLAAFAFGPPATDSRNNNVPLVLGDLSTVPLLLVGSSRDVIAPLADQRAILASTRSRGLVLEVVGGSHSLYKDNDTTILGDGTAVIPLATQQAVCRRHATAWLNLLVRGQGALAAPWLAGGAIAAADPRAVLVVDAR